MLLWSSFCLPREWSVWCDAKVVPLLSLLSTAATAACYYFKTRDWRHSCSHPFSRSRYVIIAIIMRAYLFSAPLCRFAFINLIRKVSFVARIGFRFIISCQRAQRSSLVEETMRRILISRNKSTQLDKPNLIFAWKKNGKRESDSTEAKFAQRN